MKTRRLARLFAPDRRSLVVAMDHPGFMDRLMPGLEDPESIAADIAGAGADAFLLTLGSARRCAHAIGRAGLWLSVDARPPLLGEIVETALRLGADGIKCMVYPFAQDEPESLTNFSALAAECLTWGLPCMAEVIPGGFTAGPEHRTPEKIAAGARVAMEAGADVIKTFYTGDPESFGTVIQNSPVPVVVLGGDRAADNKDWFTSVRDAMAAGAAGVAVGRNIWQHARPERMTLALAAIVHAGATVEQAQNMVEPREQPE